MKPSNSAPTREDVLDAFAVEPETGRATLERYLQAYPQFAEDLIDLSRELSRDLIENTGPLSAEDVAKIDAAWSRHLQATPAAMVDPFANLSAAELRSLSQALEIPRQVLTAFREHKVEISSVPRPFLDRFAAVLKVAVGQLIETWSLPPSPQLARSYKADVKPTSDKRATFEQILIEAGVLDEQRAKLMAKG